MNEWVASAVRDAERSNAKRSTARARDTCTTRAQHNSAHYCGRATVHALHDAFTVCTARRVVHSRAVSVSSSSCSVCPAIPAAPCCFSHTADRMFSKDSSFQAALASSPGKLREACARLVGLDQPGVFAAYVEDVPADMEQPALPTDIGVGPVVSIGTPIVYPASSLPASSSSLPLPLPSPPLECSTSVVSSASGDALSTGKATAKRVRSRKVEKGTAKRTAQMVDEVESGGEVLGNAGGSMVGQMVVWSSVPGWIFRGLAEVEGRFGQFRRFFLSCSECRNTSFSLTFF